METKIWNHSIEELKKDHDGAVVARWKEDIHAAAALIRAGELVAFPTETVYGLGADALNPAAVLKIFEAKGRPADNPLIVHVSSIEAARPLASHWPPLAEKLAQEYWPGPLTLVVPASTTIPREVTAGLATVALRVPSEGTAQKLLAYAGCPIAAPSANLSGRPSPTRPEHVIEDFDGRIAGIISELPTEIGIESTVVDVTTEVPIILRPGFVSRERMQLYLRSEVKLLSELEVDETPLSPGTKYIHYAPRAEMYLLIGTWLQQLDQLRSALARTDLPQPLALLCSRDTAMSLDALLQNHPARIFKMADRDNLDSMGFYLYHSLRECDTAGVKLILAETYAETGFGAAIMNRLRKAATGKIWME